MDGCMGVCECETRSGVDPSRSLSRHLIVPGRDANMSRHMGKRFVFKNYGWIAFVVTTVAIGLIVMLHVPKRESLIASTLGTTLAFCYFVQKQKLDELKLFNDLFSAFNERYEEMNAELEEIREGKGMDDAELKKTLVGYFNLCAEEYLFFDEGYIHPKAWQSWCSGMLYYLQSEPINGVWKQEVTSGSYYGLTLDVIEKFAGPA
jgi:hypothetical protein